MLIKALCDYYDVLASKNKVLPDGYSEIGVRYLISLNENGEIDSIDDWQEKITIDDKKGKLKEEYIPRKICVIQRTEKTCICSNIIEHRPLYIFGKNWATTKEGDIKKAINSHNEFVKTNLEFIKGIDSPVVNAYRKFIENWIPERQIDNILLINIGKTFLTSNYAFCLSGHPDTLLHEDKQINDRWLEIKKQVPNDKGTVIAQCGITGKNEEISRVHNKIKGFNAMGSALVNYNNPSDSSYGKSQSFNSNISVTAMKKYTEALNYLLSNKKHNSRLGDITVVHWAESDDEICEQFVSKFIFDDSDKMDEYETDNALYDLFKRAKEGVVNDAMTDSINDTIDDNINYYIVGLKPNSSRIAVKFIYRQKFGNLVKNIAQHQSDMQLKKDGKTIPFWRIGRELISPKSSNPEYDPALMNGIVNAVINGYTYPFSLLSNVIQRIKTDSDTDKSTFIKFNDVRIGIIKAYINRQSRKNNQKEEIKMALDLENENEAYLCGRLFAILERIQQASAGYNLNRTIRDTYFSTAASHPAIVFPRVLKLTQHHLAKLDNPRYFESDISKIIEKLDGSFPESLSLTEQGEFMIGYYQQKEYRYNKKESE